MTDLLILDRAPLWLAGRVALNGVLLFDDDPPAREAWQADTRLQRVARAVGFRNVLVHQYVDVDDNAVVAALEQLDDFDRYVESVAGWVTRH